MRVCFCTLYPSLVFSRGFFTFLALMDARTIKNLSFMTSNTFQRLIQVGQQVGGILDAQRQAD